MITKKTVYWKARTAVDVLKEGYPFFIMFTVYVLGIFLGVLFFKKNEVLETAAKEMFGTFVEMRTDRAFFSVFYTALLDWLPFLGGVFICGISIFGTAVLPLIISLKGFLYGLLTAYLYSAFSINGIVYALVIIIPSALFGAYLLFFAAKSAFMFSVLLSKQVMPEPRANNLFPKLVTYCKHFAFLLILTAFAALTDALLSVSFNDRLSIM